MSAGGCDCSLLVVCGLLFGAWLLYVCLFIACCLLFVNRFWWYVVCLLLSAD